MQELIFIKLGGSLITDKSKPYTAKPEIITQLFKEIKTGIEQHPEIKIIIGHGAGSFAHTSAKHYDTINGFNNDNGKFGACVVHADALKLHQLVLEKAISVKLPVYGFQPSSFMQTENKQFYSAIFGVLITVLQNGMIPLLYGDVILDRKIGATIYSTDRLFSLIIRVLPNFKPDTYRMSKVIHVGNYDGVLNANGKVVPLITPENFKELKKNIGESEQVDVTGGMISKVTESLALPEKGIKSYIINGNIKGNILKAIKGGPVGTQIARNK